MACVTEPASELAKERTPWIVIVSEETGSISVAVDGMLKRHLTPDTFEKILRNELIASEDVEQKKSKFSLLNFGDKQ